MLFAQLKQRFQVIILAGLLAVAGLGGTARAADLTTYTQTMTYDNSSGGKNSEIISLNAPAVSGSACAVFSSASVAYSNAALARYGFCPDLTKAVIRQGRVQSGGIDQICSGRTLAIQAELGWDVTTTGC
ncbi:MAG: hypothetical protein R3E95_23155 [Thiolinea sp.]